MAPNFRRDRGSHTNNDDADDRDVGARAATARRRHRARRAGAGHLDGAGAAVPRLAVGRLRAGNAGGDVGGGSVPSAPRWSNLRHAEATMDTLVSVGVLAAYGWSTYAVVLHAAGDAGMKMSMSLVPSRGDAHHLYFEVASATVALILLGRYFEARAKRRAGGALRALLRLGATTATVVLPDGRPRRATDRRTARRRPVLRLAGRTDRHRRDRRGRVPRPSTPRC